MNYVSNNEISIKDKNFEQAFALVKVLMDNGYVCMLSYEENLIIINYEWTYDEECDRNGVVFLGREDFEFEWFAKENEQCQNLNGKFLVI